MSRVASAYGATQAAKRLFTRVLLLNSSLTASEQTTIVLVLLAFILGCIVKYFL